MIFPKDPVHYHEKGSEPNHPHHKYQDSGWYFWDETWGDRYGPYSTQEKAHQELHNYVTNVLGGENP